MPSELRWPKRFRLSPRHSAGCCTPLRAASREVRGFCRGARLMRAGSADRAPPLVPLLPLALLLLPSMLLGRPRLSSCSRAGSSCCQLSAAASTGVSQSRRALLGAAGAVPSRSPPQLLLASAASPLARASRAAAHSAPSSSRVQSTATSRLTAASAKRRRSSAAAPACCARLDAAPPLATNAVTWVLPSGKRRLTSCSQAGGAAPGQVRGS